MNTTQARECMRPVVIDLVCVQVYLGLTYLIRMSIYLLSVAIHCICGVIFYSVSIYLYTYFRMYVYE